MFQRVLLAVVLVSSSLAGCAATSDAVEPPDEGRFVTVWWTCGFMPEGAICPHWQLDADGTLIAFEGVQEPGDGSIHAKEGALYNVTTEEVRSILRTFDLYDGDTNYTVDLAYRGHATDDEIDRLLVPAAGFYGTQAHYDDPTIADAGTLNLVVESQRGTHTSSAYTGDGDEAFDRMREAFWGVRDAVEDRLGVQDQR